MIGDVTEGIADDASLGDQPVAGKTGTSENFFDAWFIGYTPHLLTGLWMGYADGGQTLEYELEYARELNGLSGGITPDRKSTRLNSSHANISYAVFCLKKKNTCMSSS